MFRNTDNWTDVEDRLKKLDRLTQEEAEMAAAQVLKATHAVDDAGRVRGVADIALSVDNKVAGVGDQVHGVGDQVHGVSDQVQGVGDQVQGVSDRIDDVVAAVRDGARYTFNQSSKNCLIPNVHRWKRGQDSHATSSRWRRSDRTFVVSELHSCCTCRLNYRHRESITTRSS